MPGPRIAPAAPPTANVPPRLRQAAQAFEAQAFAAMLAPAFATVDMSRSRFGGGSAEAQWQPMLLDSFAKAATRGGAQPLGIGDAVLREMLRAQGAREPQSRTETTR
jgi:peptidoglycan hydrolase FlgJ